MRRSGPTGAPARSRCRSPSTPPAFPATVRSGSVVDVWAGPDPQAAARAASGDDAERLLREVPVLSVERPDGLGPGTVVPGRGRRPRGAGDRVAEAVAGLAGESLLVVAHDG